MYPVLSRIIKNAAYLTFKIYVPDESVIARLLFSILCEYDVLSYFILLIESAEISVVGR